jgi:hypothetical protein
MVYLDAGQFSAHAIKNKTPSDGKESLRKESGTDEILFREGGFKPD